MKRLTLTLIPLLLLAACASQSPAPVVDRTTPAAASKASVAPAAAGGPAFYTVKKGDNLYRICLLYTSRCV